MSKVTIRNRPGSEGQLSKGANMQVCIDGVPVKGATFVKFEVKVSKMAKVTIELFAEVDIEVDTDLQQVGEGEPVAPKLARYRLGSYYPVTPKED